ncbi:hypothetical protein GDO78_005441 [Eleutherodactylus coqui]|uniref:Uncharacterized protein n=1 Tax=Eleutherodactylus coqui TaxID=57060 RepID=A0A8J6KF92_ELECQ|nr:hypothetical protein GDO78_005441 [Eleutherodactylus coqui]
MTPKLGSVYYFYKSILNCIIITFITQKGRNSRMYANSSLYQNSTDILYSADVYVYWDLALLYLYVFEGGTNILCHKERVLLKFDIAVDLVN